MAGEFGSATISPDVQAATTQVPFNPGGEFGGGLRSGALGMGSQLESIAGSAGRALGADEFAANREQAAREMQAESQKYAPSVGSLRDIKGISDIPHYLAGFAGSSIPSIGLGMAAAAGTAAAAPALGLGAAGAGALGILGGTAAMTPFAAGDIAQRQMLHPEETAGMTPGQKFARQAIGGLGTSLAQNVIPGVVGGKLVGSVLGGVERAGVREGERALLQAPEGFHGPMPQIEGPMPGVRVVPPAAAPTSLRNAMLSDAAIQGVTGAGGEAISQQAADPNAPLDWKAIAEAGGSNALIGGPLGGLGHVADRAYLAPGAGMEGLRNLAERGTAAARDLATRGTEAARAGAEAVGEAMPTAPPAGTPLREMTPRQIVGAAGEAVGRGAERVGEFFGKAGEAIDQPVGETASAVAQGTRDAVKRASEISSNLKAALEGKVADLRDPGAHGELAGLDDAERTEIADPKTPPSRLTQLAEKSTEAMKTWASEKAADDSLTPESRAKFQAFADNPTDARAMAGAMAEQTKIAAQGVRDATLGKVTDIVSRWNENRQGVKDWNAQRQAAEDQVLQRASAEGWSKERTDTEYRKAMDAVNDAAIADQDAIDAKKGGKKSLDYSATEQAIGQEIAPFMKNEFIGDRAARQKLSGLFRRIFSATGEGDLAKVESLAKELHPVFGDDTGEVMRRVYERMGGEELDGGAMYDHTAAIEEEGGRRSALRETVRQLLPEGFNGGAREVDAVVNHLIDVVTGKTPDTTHPGVKGHVDSQYQQIRKVFGKQADKVFDALDNYVLSGKHDEAGVMPEEGARATRDAGESAGGAEAEGADYEMMRSADEQNPTTTYHGGALQDPARLRQRFPEGVTDKGAAVDFKGEKMIEALQKQHPAAMVDWVSERERTGNPSEREDVGRIRVTHRPQEGGFAIDDYKHAKLDTGSYATSESRINVPLTDDQARMLDVTKTKGEDGHTLKLDAVALAKRGMDLLKSTKASAGESDAQRRARGFFEGMSQLMTDFGVRPKIDPKTIIGFVGGKPFRVSDAMSLDPTTAGDRARDARMNEIVELNKQLYGYTAKGQKVEPTITEAKERKEAEYKLKGLESGEDFRVAGEQAKGETTPLQDVEQRLRTAVNQIANLTASGTKGETLRAREAIEALQGATQHQPAMRKMGDEGQIERGGRRFAPSDEASNRLTSALDGLKLNPDKKLSFKEQKAFERLNEQIVKLRGQRDELMSAERARADYTTEGSEGRTELSAGENIHATQLLEGKKSDTEALKPGAGAAPAHVTPEGTLTPQGRRAAMREVAGTRDEKSGIAVQGERGELRGPGYNANHWIDAANQLADISATGKHVGDKLTQLAQNADSLSRADRNRLEGVLTGSKPLTETERVAVEKRLETETDPTEREIAQRSLDQRVLPSRLAPVVNELHTKYAGGMTEARAAPAEPSRGKVSERMQGLIDKGHATQHEDGTFMVSKADATPHVAGTTSDGEIYVNTGQLDAKSFADYMKDSRQKQVMLDQLGVTPKQFATLFKTRAELVDFLKAHEESHLKNEDTAKYPRTAEGKLDVMHADALAIEKRATMDALTPAQQKSLAGKAKRNTAKTEGGTPSPKAGAAQVAALDKAASSSDPALLHELKTTDDIGALGRTASHLAENHPETEAAQAAADRFDTLAKDPDTAYSALTSKPGEAIGPVNRGAVEKYISDVLGPKVAIAWRNIMHAGEFVADHIGPLIKLSVHVLNPMSVAYHESLHGFFHALRTTGNQAVSRVLEKAASQSRVHDWMTNYYKDHPEVLKQLAASAEERAAYMYQLYFNEPSFKGVLNPQATTMFERIGALVNDTLGLWSNDQRAIHIMEHFQSGEFAKGIGQANVTAVMSPGTNKAVNAFHTAVAPMKSMWDAMMTTGNQRMRDMGIDAVNKIADLIHIPVAGEGAKGDTGWIAAARTESISRMNQLAKAMGDVSPAVMDEAMTALQHGRDAASPEAKRVQDLVYETLQELGGAKDSYMRNAGLQYGDLGERYFPRNWDPELVGKNPEAFKAMLQKYADKGHKIDPEALTQRLLTNDGNDFDVDTRTPGMQNLKERSLDFISADDAAAFVRKDLFATMASYVNQAARRAEWSRRFGGEGEHLTQLLKDARAQGATPEQLQTIDKYIKGVTGTLGDGINPTARRWIGNALVYQNVRLLPLAIFSSIVDPMGIALRGGSLGDAFSAFKQGVRDIPRNFQKEGMSAKSVAEEMAQTLGTIENAGVLHALGSLHTQGMVSDFGRKVNDTFFRWNMMEQWNRTMRTSATETAQRFIMRHTDGAGPHSERFIKELGLQKGDVQTVMVPGEGGKMVPRMKLFESDGLTKDQAMRVRDGINKWVDGAILRPNTADKPIYFNDPHFAMIAHLKQFTYSFQQTIIRRVVDEAKMGNYRPAAMLASYVPISIAADFLKGMVQGGGSQPAWKQDWGPGDYVWSGIQRAGLMGVGQMGVDASTSMSRSGGLSAVSGFAGPTIQQLVDGLQVAAGNKRFLPFAVDAMPANALYKPYLHLGPESSPSGPGGPTGDE